MATEFTGEHLLPGQLGYFFVIISFVASLFSAFSYLRAAQTETVDPFGSKSWLRMGRGGFITHTVAIVSIFVALYYVIANHLFEYHYAWSHSSLDLPGKYLLSCFWEGQEGSFMLWMFWHSILGLVVMRTAKSLETRTMTIIAMVQVILGTMLLGIHFGPDIKVGSTPFLLLRHAMQGAPIFSMPNYMSFVKDGNGLNVSLQNYWMVIHPPVLFLGFALSLIPFAYCIAALWKGDYITFLKPTIAWTLVCGAILGTGIMMGGRWAYESLNFGGYWAWDPVENASLVPWLTLIAGLHTLLIYRSTGRALTITFIFLTLSQLLVWYSTFLTRTGILGKTSVHAFTGDGQALYYHLLIVLGILLAITVWMLALRWRKLPRIGSEEATLSREFWMFIGSAVIFISAVMIIFSTSQPVWAPLAKMITGKEPAPPIDVMKHYNDTQVWIAIVIGILAGATMYMKYKKTEAALLWRRIAVVAVISGAMTFTIGYLQHIDAWQYALMLFSACFSIVASIAYGISVQKTRIKNLGPVIGHLGFAMSLLGILLSSFNKHVISFNTTGIDFGFEKGSEEANMKESRENEILFLGTKVAMGDYFATYTGDSSTQGKDKRVYYKVKFERLDSVSHKATETFMLYPDAFINPKGNESGLSANPDTKHYLTHDVYTFINSATDKSKSDTSTYKSHIMHNPGDTIYLDNGFMTFDGFSKEVNDKRYEPVAGDIAVTAKLTVHDMTGGIQHLSPIYIVRNKEYATRIEDTIKSMDLYTRLENIIVKSQDSAFAEIMVRQTNPKDDYIVLKALVFPYINVLWGGVIVMVLGFFVSLGKLLGSKTKTRVSADLFPEDETDMPANVALGERPPVK
ncbi:MAG: cytochrome c biogenesis protein CcsA [Taibaiella sp.]|nr:cytochrome c biogenesis protein CcsA [Taibaiella sp.]